MKTCTNMMQPIMIMSGFAMHVPERWRELRARTQRWGGDESCIRQRAARNCAYHCVSRQLSPHIPRGTSAIMLYVSAVECGQEWESESEYLCAH
jgi:hypothetical protein